MPELSHLTEEERSLILAVMERQRREEEQEQSALRYGGAAGPRAAIGTEKRSRKLPRPGEGVTVAFDPRPLVWPRPPPPV